MINAGIISKNILHFKKEVVSFLMKKKDSGDFAEMIPVSLSIRAC